MKKVIGLRVVLVGVLALPPLLTFAAPASATPTQGYGLLVQNEWTEPVYIDPGGSLGAASCVNNWGNVPGLGPSTALNQGQNNATNNPITVEFTAGGGSCSNGNTSWMFPFTVIVGGTQIPAAMIYFQNAGVGGETWCQGLSQAQYPEVDTGEYPVGLLGATNMACNEQVNGNDAQTDVFYWLSPNPLVVYGSGYDVLMNSVSPITGNGNACQNSAGWHGCLSVQVVPEGATFATPGAGNEHPSLGGASDSQSAANVEARTSSRSGVPPIVMPEARRNVFASHPSLAKASTAIHDGRLSVKLSTRLGSAAGALLSRVGTRNVRNWVTISASTGTGTKTISGSTTTRLGSGALDSSAKTQGRTLTFSRATTSAICQRLSSAAGSTLTVTIQQFIAEPTHTYEMVASTQLASTRCATPTPS